MSDITVEQIVQLPLPGMNVPGSLSFSPDGQSVVYLYSEDGSLTRQLYAFDLETAVSKQIITPPDGGTTDDNISLEEALRRERMRQREFGITSYDWNGKNNQILVPIRGSLYLQAGVDGKLRQRVEATGSPAIDPTFSPDGEWIAYVQDGEVYIISVAGGDAQQLTSGARGTGKTNGLAEYIAQEEMARRHGYWWSPDSQAIAYIEVDETHIPAYRIMHQGKDAVGEGAQEDHHYPFAGQPNAKVRMAVIARDGGDPVWLDLGADEDIYIARVNWLPNGKLTAQILNREQSRLDLVQFDPQTGESQLLLREETAVWINLHTMFTPLKDGRFLWASERTGFQHLYLYDGDGRQIEQLTSGEWMVESIVGVDQQHGVVYFMATHPDPRESHLFAVSFAGGEPRQITQQSGMHAVVVDVKNGRFLDTCHNVDTPASITLRSLADGVEIQSVFTQTVTTDLPTPELVSLQNRDGVTLYGAIYRPPAKFGEGPFPTIVSTYGGPHAQVVSNNWYLHVDMRAQYLASQGFVVFKLDNQGSARRGLAFEGVIKHNMGDIEIQDQVDGVRWLVAQGLTDPERVGIYGWSYGGYMSAMALARAGDTFKAAVSGAPVTHWDGYDTCYTERYMGTPQSNPEGYDVSRVMAHVENLDGKLLLVHGLIDENVHFRHTARLINGLIGARKRYDLLIFPDGRHGPRKPADRIYLEERIRDFFLENL